MMTGNGVMHNGTTVIEQYGQNLDRLQVGDRVGVVRKDDGTLHFWVNGVDQGPGATNVPERVYGVIGRVKITFDRLAVTDQFRRKQISTVKLHKQVLSILLNVAVLTLAIRLFLIQRYTAVSRN